MTTDPPIVEWAPESGIDPTAGRWQASTAVVASVPYAPDGSILPPSPVDGTRFIVSIEQSEWDQDPMVLLATTTDIDVAAYIAETHNARLRWWRRLFRLPFRRGPVSERPRRRGDDQERDRRAAPRFVDSALRAVRRARTGPDGRTPATAPERIKYPLNVRWTVIRAEIGTTDPIPDHLLLPMRSTDSMHHLVVLEENTDGVIAATTDSGLAEHLAETHNAWLDANTG
jgi:hypothetical protein